MSTSNSKHSSFLFKNNETPSQKGTQAKQIKHYYELKQ